MTSRSAASPARCAKPTTEGSEHGKDRVRGMWPDAGLTSRTADSAGGGGGGDGGEAEKAGVAAAAAPSAGGGRAGGGAYRARLAHVTRSPR